MSFFKKFFQKSSKQPSATQHVALPNYTSFMGAGCVFTDGKHVLGGYQPHKSKPGITGIGGHREGEETYLQTAYRETIEEVFHVKHIPVGLIKKLETHLKPRKIAKTKGYVLLTFTFDDLCQFLKLCKKSGLRSPLYDVFPTTLITMIQSRGYDLEAEISSLALLPVVKSHQRLKNFVHPLFIEDMRDM